MQDQAPDIYETPELTDDNSTLPAQSESAPTDIGDDDNPEISRLHLDPDAARSAFLSTRVSTREADFSDRLDSQRKSYRVTSRRRRISDGDDEDTETSGDEAPSKESIRRRIARLQRQAQELKAEVEKQSIQDPASEQTDPAFDSSSLEALNTAIKDLQSLPSSTGTGQSASTRLALRLGKASQLNTTQRSSKPTSEAPSDQAAASSQHTLSHAHALSLAATFDTRLTTLETALGLPSLPLATQSPSYAPKPLLPSLDILDKQLDILSSASPPFLDTLSARLRQLTFDADALDEKRRETKSRYEEMRAGFEAQKDGSNRGSYRDSFVSRASGGQGQAQAQAQGTQDGAAAGGNQPPMFPATDDPEVASKVNALYGTLGTIESLAPMLPVVVERLKSLRLLHQDAAGAAGRVEECERRGAEMGMEVERWEKALKSVEGKIRDGEEAMKENLGVVEGWVKELEGRVGELKK
ncbi:MAG: hypothetical protein MMC23_003285 [Stictis urceolatum]|nr:hypothetical protein [Stictis urceolata]